MLGAMACLHAQDAANATTVDPATPAQDKRAFGIIPNYKTADEKAAWQPLSSKKKMWIAYKDSVDWPIFVVSGFWAGLGQWTNTHPSFGQGIEGYAKRYAGLYADQSISTIFVEGVLPNAFHEDPRYFRRGTGSFASRLAYSSTRVFVTRTDRGTQRFNFSDPLGNAIAVGISNAYYADGRNLSDNLERFAFAVGTDALGNVMKEFWPDVKHKLLKH
jgi:hypothetical protein